jgi:hypothetical protein
LTPPHRRQRSTVRSNEPHGFSSGGRITEWMDSGRNEFDKPRMMKSRPDSLLGCYCVIGTSISGVELRRWLRLNGINTGEEDILIWGRFAYIWDRMSWYTSCCRTMGNYLIHLCLLLNPLYLNTFLVIFKILKGDFEKKTTDEEGLLFFIRRYLE